MAQDESKESAATADATEALAADRTGAEPNRIAAADGGGAVSGETTDGAPKDKAPDEFDTTSWQVPLLCKDCDKSFAVAYRHFQAGVVFHCRSCRGSFVPDSAIYRMVTQAFESFYRRRKREREKFEKRGGKTGEAEFKHRQERELEAFKGKLEEMAREMKLAGKMVKPKGLASMFT